MRPQKVTGIYFSPTGNCEKVCHAMLSGAKATKAVEQQIIDITLPKNRVADYRFDKNDLVLLCVPVYAGRIPNKLQPFVDNNLKGSRTPAIVAVCYGNRSFDNALIELRETLTPHGFHVVGALAIPSEHAFSHLLAPSRPNAVDLQRITDAVSQMVLCDEESQHETLPLPGEWPCNYYVPKGEDHQPVNFLKAKPVTDSERCTRCGLCAQHCPMGSISQTDPTTIEGICIKCHSCIRRCPSHAKQFDDQQFASHVKMLEHEFTAEKALEIFL